MQLHEEHFVKCATTLTPDDFITSFGKRVFQKMQELHNSSVKFDIAYFLEDFSQDEVSRITKMMTDRQMLNSNGADVLFECIESLKAERNRNSSEDSVDSLMDLLNKKKK